ncbi:metallophosphoesterase [Colwellia sp. MB3u-55]|uniref:metallophosphoesterase n=1 Tax=Colwellia sp. MB3u-55 TaxID=2759810 RepID=UPI00217501B3|nr:metallophosphoesterase [Colwellia sp. MB3u-55]
MMKISAAAILNSPSIQLVRLHNNQRVFVVGDLDGNHKRLKEAMSRVSFNPKADKLICLGDMIDRGDDSLMILELMRELNALVVLGNHEHLMIESILNNDATAKSLWIKNGGAWHSSVPDEQLTSHCQWLLNQPLSIMVVYQGMKIGISHTLPIKWNWDNFPADKLAIVNALLWGRELFNKEKSLLNSGVDFSIHGHNSTQVPIWIKNTLHIDTSYYGRPTMIELHTVIEKFNANKLTTASKLL